MAKTVGVYINADDIKRTNLCSDLEAAQLAEKLREETLKIMQTLHLKRFYRQTEILTCLLKQKNKGTLFAAYIF